jgi:hypothetical protein
VKVKVAAGVWECATQVACLLGCACLWLVMQKGRMGVSNCFLEPRHRYSFGFNQLEMMGEPFFLLLLLGSSLLPFALFGGSTVEA